MSRVAAVAFLLVSPVWAAGYPDPVEGDYIVKDFRFASGEVLPELKLHYVTIGAPSPQAVLILHGTLGRARGFLSESFAGRLFGPGQLLDAAKHYIVLTDAIGHGESSKPSDGMRLRFPRYTYQDMVRAQHLLLTHKLGVTRLRLVMGTSMGGMHTWMWGYMYPDFMDALMPLASAPVEIGGRNRMLRKMAIDSIRNDPEFRDGEYTGPLKGMVAAQFAVFLMTSSPLPLHQRAPTREQADAEFARRFYERDAGDANDLLYAFEASREYNPSPHLGKIQAPLFAVNSQDDEVNPPELGILEREIQRVKKGRYILIPTSDRTRGHSTHSLPAIWGEHLARLLKVSAR
jgi:homoserine O-acetyltransferase